MSPTHQLSAWTARDAYEVLQVRPDASHVVIQAAFRALAALYHPDTDPSPGSTRRMAELSDAYAQLRTADRRAVYDRQQRSGQPTQQQTGPLATRRRSSVLDFGRYAGWSIAELARRDPDYLRWLRRHSSGIRFRAEIDTVLTSRSPAPVTEAGGPE